MNSTAPLFLASRSQTRQELLRQSHIPFTVIENSFDESECDMTQGALSVVSTLARQKMDHLTSIPQGLDCFVLTTDTVCVNKEGALLGKPQNVAHAHQMLMSFRTGATVLTGFCIDKKKLTCDGWITQERLEQVVSTTITFDIPDIWLQEYLITTSSLESAGGMALEKGLQFVKSISGSYTNILGLPVCEVRQALTIMGFFTF